MTNKMSKLQSAMADFFETVEENLDQVNFITEYKNYLNEDGTTSSRFIIVVSTKSELKKDANAK